MIEYDNFQKSLKNLEMQNKNYKSMDESLNKWIHDGTQESVIQRFEICYDCLWKILKRYLKEVEGLPKLPASPKGVFRLACEVELLPSSIEKWFKYMDARIDTAHDYDGEKAKQAMLIVNDFVEDAIALYQRMTKQA